MRVFVAGATGDLGRPVVRQLTAAGHQVTGMTRQRAKVSMVEAAGARAAVADVFDPEAVRRAVAEASPEGVVDLLTAFPRRGPLRVSDFEATDRIRRQGTANVLGAAIASGARRYVAESVAFTYRWNEGERSTEESPLLELERAPGVFHRAFGGALAKERQVLEAAHEGRIEGIVLRFGASTGPRPAAPRSSSVWLGGDGCTSPAEARR
jgi:nucleoside-diphosphate-sugar epimerase